MIYLERFNEWVSSNDVEWDYTSKDKIYYGIHKISLTREGKTVEVKAKFDTGARSSSIDFSVGIKLGLSKELINKCRELDHIDVPKSISRVEQKSLERKYTNDLKIQFPEITSVQMSKSSSGFSVRAYVKATISYSGKSISTEVNLRDRSGLSCEMLIGLKDML